MSTTFIKSLNSSILSCMSLFIWILDSRASHYMSYDDKCFVYLNHAPSLLVMTVDGTCIPLEIIGFVSTPNLLFSVVYYISNITLSFASVSRSCDSSYLFMFYSVYFCGQKPHSWRLFGTYVIDGALYFGWDESPKCSIHNFYFQFWFTILLSFEILVF